MTPAAALIQQGRRFAVVGALNSVVGYAVIVAALMLGASDYLANIFGYAVGLGSGFLLHRHWAFAGPARPRRSAGSRYMIAFAIAYSVNIAIVAVARRFGMIDMPITHIAAMAGYSLCFFLLARHYVFSRADEEVGGKGLSGWVPGALRAAAIVVCATAYFAVVLANPTTHDVAWQLWIGDRLYGGSRLYIDIMEMNPPLWFWMAQGVAAVGDVLLLESRTILVAAIVLWSAAAANLVLRLLSDLPGARVFVALLCAMVAAYSLRYFGQREHLALLAAVPYAVLIARRRGGEPIDVRLAIVVALLSSAGFALKHYFIAIPVLLELWLAAGLIGRRGYAWLRPETVILSVCALCYAIAAPLLTPEFFRVIVPMVALAYHGFNAADWHTLLIQPQLSFSLIAIILARSIARRDHGGGRQICEARDNIVIAMVLTTIGFVFSFLAQKKGWSYHGLPMILAAFSALAAALTLGDRLSRRISSYPLAAALIGFLLYLGVSSGAYSNPVSGSVERMIAQVPQKEPVAALSSDPMIAWPMVTERRHPWPLRHYSLWMLGTLVENEARANPDPELLRLGDRIRRETAIDLACRPPRLILVDDAEERLGLPAGSFDLLDWLNRDPRFAEVFDHYRLVNSGDFGVRAFATSGPLHPRPSPDCRRLP